MRTTKGYYSVIQYCPDRSRMEVANIGVLLFCPDLNFVKTRMAEKNERVKKFFKVQGSDLALVNAAKIAIEKRIAVDCDRFRTVDDLVNFIDTRGNDILLTPPRAMKVADPENDIESLFSELVGEQEKHKLEPVKIPALDAAFATFKHATFKDRISCDIMVDVPVTDRALKIPYAYRNGHQNLVLPKQFSNNRSNAIQMAENLAVAGDMLHRHPINGVHNQLIIIPASGKSSTQNNNQKRINNILKEYNVRVVHEEQIPEFVKQVNAELSSHK